MNQPVNRRVAADVSMHVTVECFDVRGRAHQIDTVLGYHRRDAYAVTMTFLVGQGELTWTFARDLLARGVNDPTGDGDVLVAPGLGPSGRAVVHIDLRSPDGEILLEAPSAAIAEFLLRTCALVPPGTESGELDLDGLVRRLVAG